MAGPKVHVGASVGILIIMDIIGFFIGSTLSWVDILWMVVFGVLIDIDHILFGRLYSVFKASGIRGVLASWKKGDWLDPDPDHLNVIHTWWALVGVIAFSIIVSNPLPLVAFVVHCMIDGGNHAQNDYPKCSPLPRDILRHFALRYYPKWALYYYTKEVPKK